MATIDNYEILGAISNKSGIKQAKIKVAILEIIEKNGFMHLTGIYEELNQKKMHHSISTIYKYLKQLEQANMIKFEQIEKRKYYTTKNNVEKIKVYDIGKLENEKACSSDSLKQITYYKNYVKKNWTKINIHSKYRKETLRQYIPILTFKLLFSGLDALNQISIINLIVMEGKENMSEYELDNIILDNLKKMKSDFYYNRFKKILSNETFLRSWENELRHVPERKFAQRDDRARERPYYNFFHMFELFK